MPNAESSPLIQVLRPGVHVDAGGQRVEFTEADLQAIAASYDPAAHEAPIVVGHPTMDAPAYGWASRFVYRDGALFAEADQVEEQFAGLVREGRFKKVSVSLYGPTAKGNPKPGIWYPRHVGFLGAMPPAIKGLKSVQFAEGEDGVHDFSDSYATSVVVRLLRGMRDWMLTQFGQETADRVLPPGELDYAAESLTAERVRESIESSAEGLSPAFAETQQPTGAGDQDMSTAQVAELQAQLEAERRQRADAERLLQERRDADAAAANKSRQAAAVAFAERMVTEARVPAERRDALVAIHLQLATPNAEGSVLSFGEGDQAEPAVAVLEQLISARPAAVQFGEVVQPRNNVDVSDLDDTDAQVQFAEGVHLDPERLVLHQRVLERQRQAKAAGKTLSYADALQQLSR